MGVASRRRAGRGVAMADESGRARSAEDASGNPSTTALSGGACEGGVAARSISAANSCWPARLNAVAAWVGEAFRA